MTDLYDILELSSTASAADIDKSYRKLSLLYHPDRMPNDTEAAEHYKDIQNAYELLSDPDHRAHYDRNGETSTTDHTTAILSQVYTDILTTILNDPQHPLPQHCNLVSKMKDALRRRISDLCTARETPAHAATILTNIKGRFGQPDNLFESITRLQLEHAEAALAAIARDIRRLEDALLSLNDQNYRWEPPVKSAFGVNMDLTNNPSWRKLWGEFTEKHKDH